MVDITALIIALLIAVVVTLRKTSAGVAVLALLAGVMLDQLLSAWVTGLLPRQATALSAQYIPVVVHLLITFIPTVASLVAVKVARHNLVLSVLTSLALGFLIFFFGLKIIAPLPFMKGAAKNSGLLTFLNPYQNLILSSAAILGIMDMILSHRSGSQFAKKHDRKK